MTPNVSVERAVASVKIELSEAQAQELAGILGNGYGEVGGLYDALRGVLGDDVVNTAPYRRGYARSSFDSEAS